LSRDQVVAALRHAYTLRDRLPEVERLHTAAFYSWNVTEDFGSAEAAYRQALALDPDDNTALTNLALIVAARGQFAEAESLEARATHLEPAGIGFRDLIDFELAQGKVNPARQTLAQFAKTFPESYDYHTAHAWFPAGVGAYDSAQRRWVSVGLRFREPAQQADVHANLVVLSQIQGQLAEAERQFHQFAAVEEQRGDPGGSVFASSLLAFGYAVLRQRLMQAALAKHPLDQIAPFARPYAVLVMTYAVAGRPDLARRLLFEYEASRPDEVRNWWGPYLRGYVALATLAATGSWGWRTSRPGSPIPHWPPTSRWRPTRERATRSFGISGGPSRPACGGWASCTRRAATAPRRWNTTAASWTSGRARTLSSSRSCATCGRGRRGSLASIEGDRHPTARDGTGTAGRPRLRGVRS